MTGRQAMIRGPERKNMLAGFAIEAYPDDLEIVLWKDVPHWRHQSFQRGGDDVYGLRCKHCGRQWFRRFTDARCHGWRCKKRGKYATVSNVQR